MIFLNARRMNSNGNDDDDDDDDDDDNDNNCSTKNNKMNNKGKQDRRNGDWGTDDTDIVERLLT